MSLRTLMMTMTALCGVFAAFQSGSATFIHVALVLGFGIPGACLGFDMTGKQRGALVGGCLASVVGTSLVSGVVLIWDFAKMWA